MARFNDACAKFTADERPKIMLLRHTYVGSDEADLEQAAQDMSVYYNYFFAWFKNERPIHQALMSDLRRGSCRQPMLSPDVMLATT